MIKSTIKDLWVITEVRRQWLCYKRRKRFKRRKTKHIKLLSISNIILASTFNVSDTLTVTYLFSSLVSCFPSFFYCLNQANNVFLIVDTYTTMLKSCRLRNETSAVIMTVSITVLKSQKQYKIIELFKQLQLHYTIVMFKVLITSHHAAHELKDQKTMHNFYYTLLLLERDSDQSTVISN